MNVKFILFCIASLGCLMMMFLWFTMNKTVISSQLNEEQYLYRISSLKSEIDFEKKLIDTLRKDTKIYGQKFHETSIVLETMKKKSVNSDNERIKLEKQTEILKADFDKVNKSNEEIIKDMINKADASKISDNSEIETLQNEVKKLQRDSDELSAAQKTSTKKTTELGKVKVNKPNEMLQGKAPKLIRNSAKIKENKESEKKWHPIVPDAKVDKPQSINEDIKTPELLQPMTSLISDKIKSNLDVITKKDENSGRKIHEDSQKEIPKKNEVQPKVSAHVGDDEINNEFISKDDHFLKRPVNPKILQRKEKSQDYEIPKKNVKLSGSIKEEIGQQKSKDNMEAIHQLKPPRKEDSLKEKEHNLGNIAKVAVKNEVDNEVGHDV